MIENDTRWDNAFLDPNAVCEYYKIYGDDAKVFIHVLESSPEEIAVVSRLIAYYQMIIEDKQ